MRERVFRRESRRETSPDGLSNDVESGVREKLNKTRRTLARDEIGFLSPLKVHRDTRLDFFCPSYVPRTERLRY